MSEPSHKPLTCADVAAAYGVTIHTAARWARTGTVPAVRAPDGTWWFLPVTPPHERHGPPMNTTYHRFVQTAEKIKRDWMDLGDALLSAARITTHVPDVPAVLGRLAIRCYRPAYPDEGDDT